LTFFFHTGKELNKHGHIFGIDFKLQLQKHWLGLRTETQLEGWGIQQQKQHKSISDSAESPHAKKVEDNGLTLKFYVLFSVLGLHSLLSNDQNDPESSESDLAQPTMRTTWSRNGGSGHRANNAAD